MTDREKIDRIFEKTPNKHLLEWMRLKAMTDDKFLLSMLDEFWKPDKKDVRALVESCFMHPSALATQKYRWLEVIPDLEGMMAQVEKDLKKKDYVEAVMISRFVLTMVCRAYKEDFSEYSEIIAPARPLAVRAEEVIRDILMDGDDVDEESRIGMLSELLEECQEIGDNPLHSLKWLIEDGGIVAWPMRQYLTFINAKLRKKRDFCRDRHVANKVKCLLLHGERKKASECLEKELGDEKSRMLYVNCLLEWKEYDKALKVAEERPQHFYMHDWVGKEFEILDAEGDKVKTLTFCRRRFLTEERRTPYYRKLKSVVSPDKWHDYLETLLGECDFKCDYDDTQATIYIEEGITDRMMAFFENQGYWDLSDLKKYGKYLNDEEKKLLVERYAEDLLSRVPRFDIKGNFEMAASFLTTLQQFHPHGKEVAKDAAVRLESLVNPRYSKYIWYFRNNFKA